MKISQLPQEVKEKALKYQMYANEDWDKISDYLQNAFDWDETEEMENYWSEWDDEEFKDTVK